MTEQPVTERWIRIARACDLPLREGRAARIGDRELALFHLGDRVLAVDNQCPHQGGPLCDGIVSGQSVVCPLHAWKVNLADGTVERPAHGKPHCVRTYETRLEDGIVAVQIATPARPVPAAVPESLRASA
jgi:nitrite reductase (NADH) small subunit